VGPRATMTTKKDKSGVIPDGIIVHGKLLRWGNSFGIRLRRSDLEENGLREGDEISLEIRKLPRDKIDLSGIRTFAGDPDLSTRHDEIDWA
jgi:hypothetical protein